MSGFGGDNGALNTLEKLESAQEQAQKKLSDLLEVIRQMLYASFLFIG